MRKTLGTIVLALGLVFTVAPVTANAAAETVPCSTSPDAGPGTNSTPCAPECVPTVDFLNAVISQLNTTVADKYRVIAIINAREDAYVTTIARKDARIARQAAIIKRLRH